MRRISAPIPGTFRVSRDTLNTVSVFLDLESLVMKLRRAPKGYPAPTAALKIPPSCNSRGPAFVYSRGPRPPCSI